MSDSLTIEEKPEEVVLPKGVPKTVLGVVNFRCRWGHVNCKGGDCKISRIDTEGKWYPELNVELVQFFSFENVWEEWMKSSTAGGSTQERIPLRIPQFYRFEMDHDLHIGILSRWAAEEQSLEDEEKPPLRPGFSQAYQMAKELQKDFIVQLGVHGITPPASFIFIAKNMTGMRDKTETEISSPNGQPFQVQVTHYLDPALKKNLIPNGQDNTAIQVQPPALSEGSI